MLLETVKFTLRKFNATAKKILQIKDLIALQWHAFI